MRKMSQTSRFYSIRLAKARKKEKNEKKKKKENVEKSCIISFIDRIENNEISN